MPDSAQVTADIQNPDSSSATGWGGGSLTPLFDIKKESASVKLAAFSQPKLAIGIELIEIGNFDVALAIKLPEVSVTLTAAYDEDGVCGVGSSKTGVKLDSEVEIGVDLEIDAELGDDEDTEKPSWSHTLYSYSIPLGSMCFPLDIPGLNSSSTAALKEPSFRASAFQSTVFTPRISSSVTTLAGGSVVAMTGMPSGSTMLDGLSQSAEFSASTGRIAAGASTTIKDTQSGQCTDIGLASSDVPKILSGDSSVTRIPATVTTEPLHGKVKAVVNHPQTLMISSSSPDISPLPGLAGSGGNVLDLLNPMMTPTSLTSTTFASIASHTVDVGDGNRKPTVVHSHTSSIPAASPDTFSLPDLSGHDDILAAIDAKSTTISPPSNLHHTSPSKPAVPKDSDETKAGAVHPKTKAKTVTKESSTAHSKKPTATPPPDPLPHVKPAVENNIEDSPPKSIVIPPPPAAKKPVPVVPKTTSKPIAVATSTTPASGGGGCRMVKRFGRRMLVC